MTWTELVTQAPLGVVGILIGLVPALSWVVLVAGLVGIQVAVTADRPGSGLSDAAQADRLDLLAPALLVTAGLVGVLVG